jgi:hypothetical protein
VRRAAAPSGKKAAAGAGGGGAAQTIDLYALGLLLPPVLLSMARRIAGMTSFSACASNCSSHSRTDLACGMSDLSLGLTVLAHACATGRSELTAKEAVAEEEAAEAAEAAEAVEAVEGRGVVAVSCAPAGPFARRWSRPQST